MFTVKVKNGAHEELFACRDVSIGATGHAPQAYDDRMFYAYGVNGTTEVYCRGAGEIFVMNANGATVAKYRLGEEVAQGIFTDPRDAQALRPLGDGGTVLKAA